jgi:uncharacterized protein
VRVLYTLVFLIGTWWASTGSMSSALFAASEKSFEVPPLTSPVVDQAGILSPDGRARVEQLVRSLFESGGSQVTVLTVASLGDLSIEEASIKVVDAWKLGRDKKDDGILLMVAPNERRMRIEVGRGREGDLPDAIAKRIINQVVGPEFREGRFDGGILLGVAAIIQRSDPQFDLEKSGTPMPHARSSRRGRGSNMLFLIFVLIFMLMTPILAVLRLFGILPRSSMRGYGHTGYGGWSGSGGGWSGGGGGGWSGGGGGFSGGGSSGSW